VGWPTSQKLSWRATTKSLALEDSPFARKASMLRSRNCSSQGKVSIEPSTPGRSPLINSGRASSVSMREAMAMSR
jgi:hypothetical protein